MLKSSSDRYYLPIFAIDSQTNGTLAQYIRLTPYPEELKLIENINWIRREIAGLLGVQNVMLNDLEGVGGLNSESLQVQVTDRAALAGQTVYNDRLLRFILVKLSKYNQFDVPDDLRLIVKRTDNAENEVRMVNLERQINIALSVMDMGYEVDPDFDNLLGYDNKKLLPFDFKKLSHDEIREQEDIGLIADGERGDKVKTPTAPYRTKIPAFRSKMTESGIPILNVNKILKEFDVDSFRVPDFILCKIAERDDEPTAFRFKKFFNKNDGMFYEVGTYTMRYTTFQTIDLTEEEYLCVLEMRKSKSSKFEMVNKLCVVDDIESRKNSMIYYIAYKLLKNDNSDDILESVSDSISKSVDAIVDIIAEEKNE
jgi:hypothetical protein